MGKLNPKGLKGLIEKPGRYADGDGLYFKTAGQGRAYWTVRYTLNGVGREKSLGPFPEVTLDEARLRHLALMKQVKVDRVDPLASRRGKVITPSGAPTFGVVADAYVERQEKLGLLGKSRKHRAQWRASLMSLPSSFRDLPVAEIGARQVYEALSDIWTKTPESASRLRSRIAMVLDDARGPDDLHVNPAAWSGWLKKQLGDPRRLGKIDRSGERVQRGHHAALAYDQVPALMKRLTGTPGTAALALRFTILTCVRTSEALNATFEEVDLERAIWSIDGSRMKMGKLHQVPLSDAALAILRELHETRGENPFIFAGARPRRPLSPMSLAMVLKRMKVKDATVHGFRSSARSYMADTGVPFEVAEQVLAHTVGNAAVQAYQRSSMLERRRPVLQAWASYLSREPDSVVVPLRAVGA